MWTEDYSPGSYSIICMDIKRVLHSQSERPRNASVYGVGFLSREKGFSSTLATVRSSVERPLRVVMS